MEKMTEGITLGVGWLDNILKTIKKYSIWEIGKALMLIIVLSLTVRICIDPTFLFESWKEWQENYHEMELVERSDKDSRIKAHLDTWIYKYHAERIFVIQYHNGTKDWQHGTMRFEKCLNNVESIRTDYVNFNLTWLDMPFYLKEHNIFIGDITALREIDPVLCDQLEPFNIHYVAFILLRNTNGDPAGIYGCTWGATEIDLDTKKPQIREYLVEDRVVIRSLIE